MSGGSWRADTVLSVASFIQDWDQDLPGCFHEGWASPPPLTVPVVTANIDTILGPSVIGRLCWLDLPAPDIDF